MLEKRNAEHEVHAAADIDGHGGSDGAGTSRPGKPKPKRQRIATACIACRQRKARCNGQIPCSACEAARLTECSYPAAVKKVDRDYLEDLEQQVRDLQRVVAQQQPQPPLFSIEQHALPVVQEQQQQQRITSTEDYSSSILTWQNTNSRTDYRVTDMGSPSNQDEHDALLTLIASPDVNTHLPDSSTRTLFEEVDGAAKRLVGAQWSSSLAQPPPTLPQQSRSRAGKSAQMTNDNYLFSHSRSQQDLYSLPHRSMSDAMVRIYKDRIHPIFRILHWPTFLQCYEDTFKADAVLDKDFLGLLNQVFAIACQIGGPGLSTADTEAGGLRYYQRSLALMFPVVLQSSSLQGLQCVLLMGQYLQSISQPSLCWNTVGLAVRFAQLQRIYSRSSLAKLDPVAAESRRRAWAGVVAMETTTAATLGLPPSLTIRYCQDVEPTAIDDELIGLQGVSSFAQPDGLPSSASFMQQSYRLFTIQLKILSRLYSGSNEDEPDWPNATDIVDYDRQLDAWETALPRHLLYTEAEKAVGSHNREWTYQSIVLRARFLNAKILAHRPMLSYLCHRAHLCDKKAAPSRLDEVVAYASARICCTAAVDLLETITRHSKDGLSGAWWYQLYYIHSACLVVLASFVVDTSSESSQPPCVMDLSRAGAALRAAHIYLDDKPEGVVQGGIPQFCNASARKSARSCHRMLTGVMKALAASTASPLHLNSAQKTNYLNTIRASLGRMSETTAVDVEEPTLQSSNHGANFDTGQQSDNFEDFWALLSQTRPQTPAFMQQPGTARNGSMSFEASRGPDPLAWQDQLSFGTWPWQDLDFAFSSQ